MATRPTAYITFHTMKQQTVMQQCVSVDRILACCIDVQKQFVGVAHFICLDEGKSAV